MRLIAFSLLLHLYVGWRIAPDLSSGFWAAMFALLLAATAVFMPLGLFARRFARPPLSDRLSWVGMLFMGLFSSVLVLTFLRDVMLLVLWMAGVESLRDASAEAVPLLAFAVTAIGFLNARRTARPVRVTVPLQGLPAALEGLRIVQITDVHVGPTIRAKYLNAIVDAVNRQQPDLVAITGDLVDGSVAELAPHVAPLARLASRHGTFFVTGNHEYYSGAHQWIAELRRLGIRVLMNEHAALDHDGAQLVVAGIPDWGAAHFDPGHRPDARLALRGAPADAPKVLLAHQPRSGSGAEAAGFDLQLSGHTHGGQFLPWNFFVRFQQPYTAGLHRLGRMWLYVSRGTGYWGPPKRFGAPSEITVVELIRRAP